MQRPAPTWAYGVMTCAKRLGTLLPGTLASLARAGFDAPWLFVDGITPGEWVRSSPGLGLDHLQVTLRAPPAVRVAGNWTLSLYELYLRDPEAERFAIFQDDIACCAGLRGYLDRLPYPDGPFVPKMPVQPGYWNLYAAQSNDNTVLKDKPDGFHPSNQLGHGALALVFSRQAVATLMGSYYFAQRAMSKDRGWRAVDGGIVCALAKEKWIEYVHKPSLVTHTGDVRTFNGAKNATGREESFPEQRWEERDLAKSFRGEAWDARELLPAAGERVHVG